MGSNICMNEACRATTSSEWKKGWSLKSGGFAILCYNCGSAYEKSVFCETFHSQESGWRECTVCRKRIHCGCIVSRNRHEYMDFGGIGCISCARRLEFRLVQSMQIPGDILNGTVVTNGIRDVNPIINENQISDTHVSFGGLLQLAKAMETDVVSSGLDRVKVDKPIMLKTGDRNSRFPNLTQQCSSSAFAKSDNIRPKQGVKDTNESLPQPPINFSLTTSLPFPGRNVEGTEQNKGSFQKDQRSRNIMPKPPKPSPTTGSESNNGSVSQIRVARPPAEGRGRNQLLPRYWPRITDEELQQLSGELKSTIVPLFEKILSASDAGRIGRLVLPKACAEAYFPHITQSEGIPIRIQDIKGKEWTFQFRFWPNNNSRMYVLEGVTPCIQNMQLEAGDTVTFSRIDPGGQLVVGGRKATNNGDVQDSQTPSIPNGDSTGETSFSGVTDNMVTNGGRTSDDSMQRHMSIPEKKKLRNIKNKRLLMNIDEAMELQITWDEAQELFRPSPTSEPTIVMVEDHEFEEFEEPPIFGKKTIFTSRPSGEHEQLAQCDSCSKWRRLPLNALLSAKWTCSENIWDPKRSSCSAPEDINPRDLESSFSINKDSKKQRFSDNKTSNEGEHSGLDALATAAVLGDNIVEIGESSVGATTRHPRHRPGCTCIVCIQPPSGKGKHEPSCKCNVCLTVRRRFKTLMMRKKKRQSEREAELALGKEKVPEDIAGQALLSINPVENEGNYNGTQIELEESRNGGQLDLNCDPHKEDDLLAAAAGMSLTSLMNAATLPLDMYLRPCALSRNGIDNEENVGDEEGGLVCGDVEKENDCGNG